MEKHLKFNWLLRLSVELCEALTWCTAFSCNWKHWEKHFYKSILKHKKDNGIFVIKCFAMLLLKSLEKTKTVWFRGSGEWVGQCLLFRWLWLKFLSKILGG